MTDLMERGYVMVIAEGPFCRAWGVVDRLGPDDWVEVELTEDSARDAQNHGRFVVSSKPLRRRWSFRSSELKAIPPPAPKTPEPDNETIERWGIFEGAAEATDGCRVEPDGTCPHGYPSWLIHLGLI